LNRKWKPEVGKRGHQKTKERCDRTEEDSEKKGKSALRITATFRLRFISRASIKDLEGHKVSLIRDAGEQ